MSSYRMIDWALPALTAGALLLCSCSSDSGRPAALGNGGGGGVGGFGGSGGSGGSSGSGGTAGSAGTAGTAGSAGQAGSGGGADAVCGNDVIEIGEECEGTDFGGETCVTLGFDAGQLACVDCAIDYSGCSGVERCYDGIDNDVDGLADCEDDDCTAICTDPCSAPIPLDDPGTISASTWTHPDNLQSSCTGAGATSGPDLVFKITPKQTGVVDATLTSDSADQTLSARADCGQAASEQACSNYQIGADSVERITVPAQQGVPIYLVVDGVGANQGGSFELTAASRATVCGDGIRDPNEECDDGANIDGDGCSGACKLELSETEPNDDVAHANPYQTRFIGQIDPAGDVDVISLVVQNPGSNFVIFAQDLGDDSCANELMDPIVEVYDNGGATLVGEDDDSGPGYCSYMTMTGLGPDTYYFFVRSGSKAAPTFPYRLDVMVDVCGNGLKSVAEECDDGNTTAGDGCSPTCTLE